MLHPIFSTFLARPNLFLEHLVAYAELTGEGITEAKRSFMLKLVAWVVFVIMIVVTLVVLVLLLCCGLFTPRLTGFFGLLQGFHLS